MGVFDEHSTLEEQNDFAAFLDECERAKEKQRSRDADLAAIASGEKTVAQVNHENALGAQLAGDIHPTFRSGVPEKIDAEAEALRVELRARRFLPPDEAEALFARVDAFLGAPEKNAPAPPADGSAPAERIPRRARKIGRVRSQRP